MENTNTDNITRDILATGRLEISDPHFTAGIMNKIMEQKRRRSVINYILLCSLLIIVVSVAVILLLQPGHAAGAILPPGPDPFNNTVLLNINNTGNWIMDNGYLFLPLIILLLFKFLIDSGRIRSPRANSFA